MDFEIELSKDGYRVLKFNMGNKKIYLGSKYNQEREINKIIESFKPFTSNDNYIVVGLSFGEHVKELIEKTAASTRILVIEVNTEWLEFCNKDEEIKKIINNERVIIAKDEVEVKKFFREYITQMNVNNLNIGYCCNYDILFKEGLKEIYSVIRNESNRIITDKNTSLYFGETWFNTLLSNLKYMTKATPINFLRNKYKNKPAIIVSAGPSLNKNIHELKNVCGNALILSGGRTLRPLKENDIEPSIVGVVDAGEVSYKLVEGFIENTKAPLLFYDGTNNLVVDKHNGNKIFSSNNELLDDIYGFSIDKLSSGGSIAHVLTVFAAYIGCSPIVFIGQDLAYTGEKGHAECAENNWQKLEFDNYKKKDDLYVKDINGDLVRTSVILDSYRVVLEEIIESFPEIEFINATEGGAFIKGASVKSLKSVIDGFEKQEIIPIDEYLNSEDKTEETIKILEKTVNSLDKTINLCKRGKHLLDDFYKAYRSKVNGNLSKYINELDKIDKSIRENMCNLSVIESQLFETTYSIENSNEFLVLSIDTKGKIFEKNISKNRAIYDGLEGVCKKSFIEVKKIIKEMNLRE
ncbi:Uncharacterized conserved protein [Clostridium cavendishii DSM 21758]|uniref:Uncharacterized conserved protein n=1 Tax=Clostridium cavendishii DSM 21758 TaxID=1121302 RepID=A0A1M6B1C1_9CLOT|nr:6-hydroxymethylpterin diphosphokinase MptE-like protein [Clostridium cavendishii]SHI42505.1 Uncharacterized conserved protein [Clostridium cavendishii DSM 21758]